MTDLSPAVAPRKGGVRAASESAPAALGGTLRAILLTPDAGWSTAFTAIDRRRRTGARTPEGAMPYVLGAAGGAQLMLLWLKLGGLLDLRSVKGSDFEWSYLVVAVLGAALLAVVAQYAWGPVGRIALSSPDAPAQSSRLRFAWGAAALPQTLGLLVLLPLDLVLAGRDLFTAARMSSTVGAAWAAVSVALSVSLAAWSLYLFYRGIRAATGASTWKAIGGIGAAFGCLLFVAGGFLIGTILVSGGGS